MSTVYYKIHRLFTSKGVAAIVLSFPRGKENTALEERFQSFQDVLDGKQQAIEHGDQGACFQLVETGAAFLLCYWDLLLPAETITETERVMVSLIADIVEGAAQQLTFPPDLHEFYYVKSLYEQNYI